jgi:hypothetical protein
LERIAVWFTVEVFGVTVLAIGVGSRSKQHWISNTDGSFELAPQEVEEYEYEEEDCFGFR